MIFIHRHKVFMAISKKMASNCYSIDGFNEVEINKEMIGPVSSTYYNIYCNKCRKLMLESNEYKEFKMIKNAAGLRNYFNEKGKIENVSYEDKPHINLISNEEYTNIKFYKLIACPEYDKNTYYIGTPEEQKEYFHRRFIELKEKTISQEIENKNNKSKLEEGEKELRNYRAGILFKGNKEEGEMEDAYDIIIGINSILSLNKDGWDIKYQKGREEYEKKVKKKTIIVGVLGNRNKGKSFILGKLSGYDVPQGFSIKTEGVSVRFGEKDDHCIAILDSAGQEVPLLNFENNEIKNIEINNNDENIKDDENKNEINEQDDNTLIEKCLRDKLITEKFIEEFIIYTSDILVLVVGSITLNEQKILARVKNSLGKEKYLFIIHNLQNFQSKWQVNDYIENTLKKLYGIKIEENNYQNIKENRHNKYYVEENNKKITHLIFVNDYSPIAEYYNEPTTDFLKGKLIVEQNRQYFSVIEKCKKFFIDIQDTFLEESIKYEDFEKNEDKILVKNKNIVLKKVFIDEIGKTITNDSNIPNYNYYTEKNDLIINVELPGPNSEITSKISSEGEFYNFGFKGKKSGDNSDSKEKHLISKNLKKPTEFKFSIRISKKDITILPNEKGKIQFYSKTETNVNGIFTFKYHIADPNSNDDYE